MYVSQRVMLVCMIVCMFKAIQGQFVCLSVISESNACVYQCVYVQGNTGAVRLSICDLRE